MAKDKIAAALRYVGVDIPEWDGNGNAFGEALKRNSEELKRIDAIARGAGTILGRSFSLPVGDGKAIYQVVELDARTVKVVRCSGICPDEWQDSYIGQGRNLDRMWVEQAIKGEDAMRRLFGR